jgi:hypothetical protein
MRCCGTSPMQRQSQNSLHGLPWPTEANDMKAMLEDMREQRDRWQAQAERLATLPITDQRKEAPPAPPQLWWQWLRSAG